MGWGGTQAGAFGIRRSGKASLERVAFEQGRVRGACLAEGMAKLEALRPEQAWYRKAVCDGRVAEHMGGGGPER